MRLARWEAGSEFHWLGWTEAADQPAAPWVTGLLLSTGRDALRLVLDLGMGEHGWRRLWIPEYFCQEVTTALLRPGLELVAYPDHPLQPAPDHPAARAGDAVLVVNYHGLRRTPGSELPEGVALIEDHSHDPTSPWALASTADYCVASVRKTVPLPDGGVVWSPQGHRLPRQPRQTEQRRRAAAMKLAAMVLKGMYLDGHAVEKRAFRSLALRSERALSIAAVSSMSDVSVALLAGLSLDAWRRARAANHAQLTALLEPLDRVEVLRPADASCVPHACTLLLATSDLREQVRARLLAADVFPAVLWPLEKTVLPVGATARELSRRLLTIHCDGRYGPSDIDRLAAEVRSALGE